MSILDMSSRIGHRARAVKHVMDVYKSVILRPRFKVEEIETKWVDAQFPNTTFIFKVHDSSFSLNCRSSLNKIYVMCTCHDEGDGRDSPWPFRFNFKDNFEYKEFGKLRQKALILMKKIAAKPVYDTMLE